MFIVRYNTNRSTIKKKGDGLTIERPLGVPRMAVISGREPEGGGAYEVMALGQGMVEAREHGPPI